jgi:DNA-binding CsgD family transcriptional regulator
MLETLSPREREISDLLLKGVSPKEIAHKLNITLHTVAFHRTKLYTKLDVQSIQELFAKYSTNGKEPSPEALEAEAIPLVSPINKKKRLKVLLSVGIALVALSLAIVLTMTLDRKSSAYTAPKGAIPITNLGFSSTSDSQEGGKSTSEVYVSREKINGKIIDNVLNIKTNLIQRENSNTHYAGAYTMTPDLIQQLRQANGIRFKALGDGKTWNVQFHTKEPNHEEHYVYYTYMVHTVHNQLIDVDIPYSSLILPDWWEQKYSYDFNKETISTLTIIDNWIHGYGLASLQIFDFEIY